MPAFFSSFFPFFISRNGGTENGTWERHSNEKGTSLYTRLLYRFDDFFLLLEHVHLSALPRRFSIIHK